MMMTMIRNKNGIFLNKNREKMEEKQRKEKTNFLSIMNSCWKKMNGTEKKKKVRDFV